VGELLRSQRESRGLTQAEAAAEIGTSQATLNRWEMNRAIPLAEYYRELMRFLDLDGGAFMRHLLASSDRERRGLDR
jgi:transcriptional regulator with XRE-family HTH domain